MMAALKKSSVHTFTYIGVFLLVISVIVYLNIIFQQNLKTDIAKQFNRQQLLLARGASRGIEKHIDNYIKHLVTLAQLPAITNMEDGRARDQVLKALMDEIPADEENAVYFRLIDKNGIIRLDRPSTGSAGRDVSGREYFSKARQLLK